MEAFKRRDKDEVLLLLPCAVQPQLIRNVTWEDDTLLHHAAQCGWADVCRILVEEYHCKPDDTDHFGRSVLHMACEEGQVPVVKYLLTLKSVLGTATVEDRSGRTSIECVNKNKYEIFSLFSCHVDFNMELRVKAYFKLFMAGNE